MSESISSMSMSIGAFGIPHREASVTEAWLGITWCTYSRKSRNDAR
jgi:hypothetical protein